MNEKRILILPSPPNSGSLGSTTKCIGIARKLVSSGCKVAFVMGGKLGELIRQNGFQVYHYPLPIPKKNLKSIDNTVDFIEWTGMADEEFVKAAVEEEVEAIRDFKPTAIFSEARPSACISAKICQVPLVSIASWPIHPDFPENKKQDGRNLSVFNRYLKSCNMQEIENLTELLFTKSDVKLAPTLPDLEPELARTYDIIFTGYILDEEEEPLSNCYREWIDDGPLIFIYLSVGALMPEMYQSIIEETFMDTKYKVVCACGYHYALGDLQQKSSNIRFEKYVPAASIIKHTSLVIFHGGQDTMLTTLLHGLPSITIPGQHFERDYNATKQAALGTSIKLPVFGFRPNRILSAMKEIQEGDYISCSQKIAEKLKQYGGTAQCAEILMSF